MMRYELFGRATTSGMPLPELQPAAAALPAGFRFERRMPPPIDGAWFVIWPRPDGEPWVRACRTGDGYRIQYCRCAEFHLDLAARRIDGETIDCSEEMFRHFLVDQVVPLATSLESPVLHASSVVLDGGQLIAFSGPGGSGKSTLATALARRGHRLGADDALLVRAAGAVIAAVPAYPGIRLWPDSEAAVAGGLSGSEREEPLAKRRFGGGLRFARAEALLTQIYLLDPVPAPSIGFERLSSRDAVIELVRETYRLALDDRDALAREFAALTTIAGRVVCWRLRFPRSLDRCAALAAAVEVHQRADAMVTA